MDLLLLIRSRKNATVHPKRKNMGYVNALRLIDCVAIYQPHFSSYMADALGLFTLNSALMGLINIAKASYPIHGAKSYSRADEYQLITSTTTGVFTYAFVFISDLSISANSTCYMSSSMICVAPNCSNTSFSLYDTTTGGFIRSDKLDGSNCRLYIASTSTAIEFYLLPVTNQNLSFNGFILVF